MRYNRPFVPSARLAILLLSLVFLALMAVLPSVHHVQPVVGAANPQYINLTPTVPLTATPACNRAWEIIDSPNVGNYDNGLGGVVAFTADNIWAVGNYATDSSRSLHTLVQHWDGTQWSVVPSPYAGTLSKVAGVSPDDIWAVGSYGAPGPFVRTLIEHWDGSQWSIVPSPNPSLFSNSLHDVAVISTNDAWAVGYSYENAGPGSTLIVHWDGTAWTIVPSPNPNLNNVLTGVVALSADNVWAVGNQGSTTTNQTLVLHWDGNQWSVVPSPDPPSSTRSYLSKIAAVSPNDIWAVGWYQNASVHRTLTEHWDGSKWSIIPSPNVGTERNVLGGIWATSSTDVWATGSYDDLRRGRTLTMHWDGNAWTVIPSPSPATGPNGLGGIVADPLGNVWTVGGYSPFPAGRTLVLRYPILCPTDTPSPTPTNTGTPPTATRTHTPTNTPTNTPTPCGPNAGYSYATGTATIVPGTIDIGNHCGGCFTTITLPFSYSLYDRSFPIADISSDGYISFAPGFLWELGCLPALHLHYTIFPYWQDQLTNCSGCGIFTSTTGASPNRVFNIEWRTTYLINPNQQANFELRLYEGQTYFEVIYGRIDRGISLSASGVQKEDSPHGFTQYFCRRQGGAATGSVAYTLAGPCPSPTGSSTATSTATTRATSTFTSTPTPTRTPATGTATSTHRATLTLTVTPAVTPAPTTSPTPCLMTFRDVSPGDYFYEPVRYLYCAGVISGYGDNTFRPYNLTTRGQLAKIVVLAEGWATYTPPTPTFRDMPATDPFYAYIETAYHQGIISGYTCGPGCLEYRPGNNVTRGQLCKIVVLAEAWPIYTPPAPTFRDVPSTDPFYTHIETAYHHAIISGYTCGPACLEFRPGNNATRGQICKIVYLAVTTP